MKRLQLSIPLEDYLEAGGVLKENDILWYPEIQDNVFFVKIEETENGKMLYFKEHRDSEVESHQLDAFDIDEPLMVNGEVVLTSQLKDLVTRAYHMGAFHHNAMARVLHKDVESFTLEDFLKRENL
jgi:hypothetical protein